MGGYVFARVGICRGMVVKNILAPIQVRFSPNLVSHTPGHWGRGDYLTVALRLPLYAASVIRNDGRSNDDFIMEIYCWVCWRNNSENKSTFDHMRRQWCSPRGRCLTSRLHWGRKFLCLGLVPAASSVFHWLASASEKLPLPRSRPHCLGLALVDMVNG